MSIPVHAEWRLQFLRRLEDLLKSGCIRWQAHREGISVKKFVDAKRPLKIRVFLGEDWGDQVRKLKANLSDAARDPDKIWVTKDDRFVEMIKRLRRAGTGAKRWFDQHELDNFEAFLISYWEIEWEWIKTSKDKSTYLALFKSLNGREMFNDWHGMAAGSKSYAAFLENNECFRWFETSILDPYMKNDYSKALDASRALLYGIDQEIQDSEFRNKRPMGSFLTEKFSGIMSAAFHVSFNCRSQINFRLYNQVRSQLKLFYDGWLIDSFDNNEPELDNDCPSSVLVARVLFRRYNGSFDMMSDRGMMWELYDATGLVAMILAELEMCKEHDIRQRELIGSDLLTALDHLLFIRNKLIDGNGIIQDLLGGHRKLDELTDKLTDMAAVRVGYGYWGEVRNQVSSALGILDMPDKLCDEIMTRMQRSGILGNELLASKVATIRSRVWLTDHKYSPDEAAKWLINSIKNLDGNQTYLPWSDLYSSVERYMRRRGNTSLMIRASSHRRELEIAAQRNEIVEEIDAEREQADINPLTPDGKTKPGDEEALRMFLLNSPPPLRDRKQRRAV